MERKPYRPWNEINTKPKAAERRVACVCG